MKVFVKRVKGLYLIPLLIVLLAGCNKEEKVQPVENKVVENVEEIKPAEKVIGKIEGKMIIDGWGYCIEKDGKMRSAMQSSVGDNVFIITEDGKPIEKHATIQYSNGSTEDFDYVKIQAEEKDYWVRTSFVSKEGVLAVALEDGYFFSSTDMATMTKKKFTSGQMLVACDEKEGDFTGIISCDYKTPYGKKYYTLNQSVSSGETTIEKIRTMTRLEDYEKKTKASEKLDPVVYEEITSILNLGE